MSVTIVVVRTPPTIGAAMRRMVSEPVPIPHMIGNSPMTSDATVISNGLARAVAPSAIVRHKS